MINKHICLNTRYNLPKQSSIIYYKERILIIAPECANYIVLDNREQLDFYQMLQTCTLGEALSKNKTSEDNARSVLVQIEAKHFIEMEVPKANGLFQLHIFLTNECNLRCKHCYMYSGEKEKNEMDFDTIKDILHSFKENNGVFVTFSGGEVCKRTDFMKILQTAHGLGLNSTIMTNGTLWSERMIEQVSPLISSVQISIDGYNEEENAKVRGKGVYEKAMKTADIFLHHGIRTTIAITPWYDKTLFTKKELYIQFKHSLLKKYKEYPIEIKFTADLMDGRELNINEKDKQAYFNFMMSIIDADNEQKEEDTFVYRQQQQIIKDNWCTFGHLTISANGDVYFCGKINMVKPICNVKRLDLPSIMKLSQKARSLSKIQHLRPCCNCELRYICGGDCRIKYFDWFCSCSNIENISSDKIPPRTCNSKIKEHYYELMIKVNHRLYR